MVAYTHEVRMQIKELMELLANTPDDELITISGGEGKLIMTYIAILQSNASNTQLMTRGIYAKVQQAFEQKCRHNAKVAAEQAAAQPVQEGAGKTVHVKITVE